MNYRTDRYGNKISVLGFGCMRFSRTMGIININKAEKEIMEAYRSGVNYYDTAFIYPGSESAIGEIFERNNIRKDIYIATKLPHYLINSISTMEKIFTEQLRRLRTDYVDYYLMHMLTDDAAWKRLVDMGVADWLLEKKKSGQIRQIGFSYHGNSETFLKLIDAWDWDFCQVQYNYMDEHTQAGRRGVEYAHSKGIPVIIMEPLRGGKLVNKLPEEARRIFREHDKKKTPAQWAFGWLWNQPEVTCVLSGMNSVEMVRENAAEASSCTPGSLDENDENMLRRVAAAINAKVKVGCTGCGYCMPCPAKVDIPGTFAAYNRCYTENLYWGFYDYCMCTALRRNSTAASGCTGCGRCEKHCPQNIPVRAELANARRKLETPIYKIVAKVARIVKF